MVALNMARLSLGALTVLSGGASLSHRRQDDTPAAHRWIETCGAAPRVVKPMARE